MCLILNKGKDAKKAASFRHISLTSCIVKIMACECTPQMVPRDQQSTCHKTGWFDTIPLHKRPNNIPSKSSQKRLSRTQGDPESMA